MASPLQSEIDALPGHILTPRHDLNPKAWQGICYYMSSRLRAATQFYADQYQAMSPLHQAFFHRTLTNELVSPKSTPSTNISSVSVDLGNDGDGHGGIPPSELNPAFLPRHHACGHRTSGVGPEPLSASNQRLSPSNGSHTPELSRLVVG